MPYDPILTYTLEHGRVGIRASSMTHLTANGPERTVIRAGDHMFTALESAGDFENHLQIWTTCVRG